MANTVQVPEKLRTDPRLIAVFEKAGTTLTKEGGTVLFRDGEPVRGVYVLLNGEVHFVVEKGDREVLYRKVNSHYIIGLPATLMRRPYSVTARIAKPSDLVFVDVEAVHRSLQERPDLSLPIVEFLAAEVEHLDRFKLSLAQRPPANGGSKRKARS